MLLGFLHKCKLTRHIQRRTPFNLLLVLKFQSTRTTQGINIYFLNVTIYYHIKLFFSIQFLNFHKVFCIYVNDVKQSFIKNCSILNFRLYATTNSNSALFSFGVKYPNTAIGMLFDLFKYAFPCFIKSSRL